METKNTLPCHPEYSREIHCSSRKIAWFTLVELIVVITILVILGTIAFVSLSGYSESARDGVRTSNASALMKGLDVSYIRTGSYPLPDTSSINILSGSTLIGYQGYVGSGIILRSKVSGDLSDPVDKTPFVYSVNVSQKKAQLLGFFENSTSIALRTSSPITEQTTAATPDYSKRYPFVKGQSLGILLSNTGSTKNQPIQDVLTGSVDVGSGTVNTILSAYTSSGVLSGTGVSGVISAYVGSGSSPSGWAGTATIDFTNAGDYSLQDVTKIIFDSGIMSLKDQGTGVWTMVTGMSLTMQYGGNITYLVDGNSSTAAQTNNLPNLSASDIKGRTTIFADLGSIKNLSQAQILQLRHNSTDLDAVRIYYSTDDLNYTDYGARTFSASAADYTWTGACQAQYVRVVASATNNPIYWPYAELYGEFKLFNATVAYPTSVAYVTVTSVISQLSTSSWTALNSITPTETLSGQTAYYTLSFDGRHTFKSNTGTTTWRSIASDQNSVHGGTNGTWYYQNASNLWTPCSTNAQEACISQALGVPANQMNGATLLSLDQSKIQGTGGFIPGSTSTINLAVGLSTSSASVTPSVDKVTFGYTQ